MRGPRRVRPEGTEPMIDLLAADELLPLDGEPVPEVLGEPRHLAAVVADDAVAGAGLHRAISTR